MIYTVTCNPAIDYVVHMDDFRPGATNRTTREEYYFGGKGINVSLVLKELGVASTALGFISGFTGQALLRGLHDKGLATDFIELHDGFTRINVKIKGEQETEINGQGPKISDAALVSLFARIERLNQDDIIVVSGSIPSTMPSDLYEQILTITQHNGVTAVVDATGDLLLRTLEFHPLLIKPNQDELAELIGEPMETEEAIVKGARILRDKGARNVLISRGGKGSILVSEKNEVVTQAALPIKVVNTVGAGDSMVAGFLAGYLKSGDAKEALMLATAAASATAASPDLAKADEINQMMQKL